MLEERRVMLEESRVMIRASIPAALLCAALFAGCGGRGASSSAALSHSAFANTAWEDVVRHARNSTVAFAIWAGEEERNRYFRGPVSAAVKEQFGITLRIVPLTDTVEAVNKLLNEKSAGKTIGGSIDLVWINGENFRAAKQGGVLWGPFAAHLPNIGYYDDASRAADFGTAIEGYEAPWQRAQFVMAYDTARVPQPPRRFEVLEQWIKAHPGRFTYPAPPDFTGSVFLRHVLLALGGPAGSFQTGFHEDLYRRASASAFEYLNRIKPYLWRGGATYPATPREMDRLFANGEIDFAMNYSPDFASVRIERGEYPPSVRTYVFDSGTIGNYSCLAIPFNSANTAGAAVVANYLMSYERLLDASRSLKSSFPLRLDRLSPAQKAEVESLPRGVATLPAAELEAHFLPEPDAAYLIRMEKDWRANVLLP